LRSIPYLIGALLAPFFGLASDKIGKKAMYLAISCGLMLMCNVTTIILMRQNYNDRSYTFFIPETMIGIAFCINVTTAIACTPYVVSEHVIGTAFGVA